MDWLRVIDGYCERTGAGYWAEPLNALTNAGFLVAAWASWRLAARAGDAGGRVLAAILGLIGAGSWLFHTHAQVWAMLLDVAPIQAFILVYIGLATVRFFAVPWWAGLLAAGAFVPASAAVAAAIGAVFGPLNGSTGYMPVPILILAYAAALGRRAPETARGLAVGAAVLALSLFFRTIDEAVCAAFPVGTHFLWHLLNAGMLWWMIRVLVRPARGRGLRGVAVRAKAAASSTAGGGPMSIDKETARRVAHLARIEVAETELEPLAAELSGILGFMEQLNEVDVEGVEPMTSVTPMRAAWRADVVTDGGYRDRVLVNAPEARDGFFTVPKVVE